LTHKIVITAGGTGGHIFPALAVARVLKADGVDNHWLGSKDGLEERLVTEFPFSSINIKGLRGKGIVTLIKAPGRLIVATFQAWKILGVIKPDLVLGLGGFVSGPTGLAAWLRRIPLVIHEQNSIAGLTNRCLSHLAKSTLQAFSGALPESVAITVGNPVRAEIAAVVPPSERFSGRTGPLKLLVLGGSQGAKFLNETVLAVMKALPIEARPELWNQTGRGEDEALAAEYASLNIAAKVSPFIENMAEAYAWADVVLARSGALTVAELAAVGVGSILIPYPHAVDNHQFYNGKYLANTGAAVLIAQNEVQIAELVVLLEKLRDREELLNMAEAARQCAWPDATQAVARECLKVIEL
jgi:UDP-N-acetylglucosamine--N-acetylmuramyl-(pentapeptide) pyrophosphoryl-undecaprenol N-acetylglucosamine transferase